MICVRRGSASFPSSRASHRPQFSGTNSTTLLTCSTGSNSRLWCLCPGCPPRARPIGFFVPRPAPGGSDDGGFDELLEFCRNPATSAARTATRFSAISSLANAAARSCVNSTLRWSRGSVSDVTQRVDHERIALPVPSSERLPSRLYTYPCFGSRPSPAAAAHQADAQWRSLYVLRCVDFAQARHTAASNQDASVLLYSRGVERTTACEGRRRAKRVRYRVIHLD